MTAFANHPTLSTGLWAYYNMDSNDGADATGAHNATPSSYHPKIVIGKNDNGLNFTPTVPTYLNIGKPGDISDWTVSGWFYMPSTVGWSGAYQAVIGGYVKYNLAHFDSSGHPGIWNGSYYQHSISIGTDTWHHVVFSQASSVYDIVLDGGLSSRATGAGSTSINPEYIGLNGNGTNQFKGYMDEFGIWSRALTDDEITDLYNSGSGLFYDQLPLVDDISALYHKFTVGYPDRVSNFGHKFRVFINRNKASRISYADLSKLGET